MARPRSEEARTRMLDAAASLALEVGVAGFTIGEVTRRSGVAKTTIYRHFSSQSALLVAALDGLVPVPDVPNTGTLRADLRAFIREVLPIFADQALRTIFLDIFAASTRDEELARAYGSMMTVRSDALKTIFERAQQRGEVDPTVDFLTAFDIIEGPLIVRSLFRPETLAALDIDALVERMLLALCRR